MGIIDRTLKGNGVFGCIVEVNFWCRTLPDGLVEHDDVGEGFPVLQDSLLGVSTGMEDLVVKRGAPVKGAGRENGKGQPSSPFKCIGERLGRTSGSRRYGVAVGNTGSPLVAGVYGDAADRINRGEKAITIAKVRRPKAGPDVNFGTRSKRHENHRISVDAEIKLVGSDDHTISILFEHSYLTERRRKLNGRALADTIQGLGSGQYAGSGIELKTGSCRIDR